MCIHIQMSACKHVQPKNGCEFVSNDGLSFLRCRELKCGGWAHEPADLHIPDSAFMCHFRDIDLRYGEYFHIPSRQLVCLLPRAHTGRSFEYIAWPTSAIHHRTALFALRPVLQPTRYQHLSSSAAHHSVRKECFGDLKVGSLCYSTLQPDDSKIQTQWLIYTLDFIEEHWKIDREEKTAVAIAWEDPHFTLSSSSSRTLTLEQLRKHAIVKKGEFNKTQQKTNKWK